MTSSQAERAADSDGSPPLSPDQFINDMDTIASYLAGRGLPLLIRGHYRWMARYLTAYFGRTGNQSQPVRVRADLGPLSVMVPFGPGSRVTPALVLTATQLLDRVWQLARSLLVRIVVGPVRAVLEYGRGNAPGRDELSVALAALGCDVPAAPRLSPLAKANAALVYVGIVLANLLLIGVLVGAALVVIGVIRIDAARTAYLSGVPAKVLLPLPGGLVVTQQLLALALTLGGLVVVSFAFVTLPDGAARAGFSSAVTRDLRRALVAWTVYEAARAHEVALTGVDSRPGSRAG